MIPEVSFQDRADKIANDASDLADVASNADVDGAYLATLDQAISALRRTRASVITQLRLTQSWGDIARASGTPIGTLRRRRDYSLIE